MDSKGMSTGTNFYSTNELFMNLAGLGHNISSSTLRHASPKFSFPKENRFHDAIDITS
jgi:hypothetical protein